MIPWIPINDKYLIKPVTNPQKTESGIILQLHKQQSIYTSEERYYDNNGIIIACPDNNPLHLFIGDNVIVDRLCRDEFDLPLDTGNLRCWAVDSDGILCVVEHWLQKILHFKIKELPETQQKILALRFFENLDPEDIALVLEYGIEDVMHYLHIALEAMNVKKTLLQSNF